LQGVGPNQAAYAAAGVLGVPAADRLSAGHKCARHGRGSRELQGWDQGSPN
jgi:hypothetical protein